MNARPRAAPDNGADEPSVLLRHDRDGVAVLTLNRPRHYNALSEALLDALQSALDAIAVDETVRVVVIAAAGRAFCAGHDLKELERDPRADRVASLFARCGKLMATIRDLPQPVIARVHGIATAAGCQHVAQCDLAIASDDARFAVSGVNLGLFCATPAVALSRNVPRKHAMEMLLTGDFIDARTAAERGLVNRAVPADRLDAEVASLAGRIGTKPRAVLALGKALFYRQLETSTAAAYEDAAATMASNYAMAEAREGIGTFVEGREHGNGESRRAAERALTPTPCSPRC